MRVALFRSDTDHSLFNLELSAPPGVIVQNGEAFIYHQPSADLPHAEGAITYIKASSVHFGKAYGW